MQGTLRRALFAIIAIRKVFMIKKKSEIIKRILPDLVKKLEGCDLCARNCKVNRLAGEKGFCAAGSECIIYSYGPHYGEEPPLSGKRGSGTIFFSRCNMGCVYCQNYQFSQLAAGKVVSSRQLSEIMLNLEERGCHNINLVSPTHFVPEIVEALQYAYSAGLTLPIVYNTGGYDSLDVIRALDGIIDIYLPDMRYSSDEFAKKYSKAPGYVGNNRLIVKEMYRQVDNLALSRGIAKKGLIIRLLILPGGISGTVDTLRFISRELGKNVYLSVMSQYYPAYRALEYGELSRRIKSREYKAVTDKMNELGFRNGWVQPYGGDFDSRFAGENFPPSL